MLSEEDLVRLDKVDSIISAAFPLMEVNRSEAHSISTFSGHVDRVDTQGLLTALLESRDKKIVENEAFENLRRELAEIESLTRNRPLSNAEVRFASARAIARFYVSSNDDLVKEISCGLKIEFIENELYRDRLITDTIASAIAMPSNQFAHACYGVGHSSGALATLFDVPVGAADFWRQRLTRAIDVVDEDG